MAEKEDLPHVYLWNAPADRTIPYPGKINIEDVDQYSPDTMLAWCHVAKLQTDIIALDDMIDEMRGLVEAEKGNDSKTDEADDDNLTDLEEHLEEVTHHYEELQQELEDAEATLSQLQNDLKEKNEFVANLDIHKETAEAHLNRLTEAHYDEL